MLSHTNQDIDRFWVKVNKTQDCWIWKAYRNAGGYGMFGLGKKTVLAHRLSYQMEYGYIPHGIHVCHHCDNPACVKPAHLFLGRDIDNVADQIRKGRRPVFKGRKNGRAKLVSQEVQQIREQYIPGKVRIVDLAQSFGVSKSQIWNIVSGREWNDLPWGNKRGRKHERSSNSISEATPSRN